MDLNLTQLSDLEHICWIAESYFEKEYGFFEEQIWLSRIRAYRRMFQAEIARLEKER